MSSHYFLSSSCRPDLAVLQSRGALPTAGIPSAIPPPLAAFTGPNLEDLEAPKRQTSMDGEQIKIVIHDVDSGSICSSTRRIILRRDPSDKAHRSEYFQFLPRRKVYSKMRTPHLIITGIFLPLAKKKLPDS